MKKEKLTFASGFTVFILAVSSFDGMASMEEGTSFIVSRKVSTQNTISQPDSDVFIEFLYHALKPIIGSYLTDQKKIPMLMNCLAFEADNLRLGDCVITAFVNLNLLNNLSESTLDQKGKDLLSRMAFLTVLFNEEKEIPVEKDSGKISIENFRKETIKSLIEYFNSRMFLLEEEPIQIKSEDGKSLQYTYGKDPLKEPSKRIIQLANRLGFHVMVVKRTVANNKCIFSSNGKTLAKMDISGNNFEGIDGFPEEKPSLVILTNDIDPRCCDEAFSDLVLYVGGRGDAAPEKPERREDHVVVTSARTLSLRNVYFSSQKGLTLDPRFKDAMDNIIKELHTHYEKNLQIVGPILSEEIKTDDGKKKAKAALGTLDTERPKTNELNIPKKSMKKVTEFCLKFNITERR